MESPECKTLNRCFQKLVTCIKCSPNGVADHLRSSKILAPEVFSFLRNSQRDNEDKARRIIESVLAQVEINSKVFNEFITALKAAGSWTESTVSELEHVHTTLRPDPPIIVESRKGRNMPQTMGITVSSVVIGDDVYVGGGSVDFNKKEYKGNSKEGNCIVMKFNYRREEWTELCRYDKQYFAMTSHNNKLVLVGGCDLSSMEPSNEIAVYKSEKWNKKLYAPFNIARYAATAVGYQSYIFVIGGFGKEGRLPSVEVLDLEKREWHYVHNSMPIGRSSMNSTLSGSTLYLMGGKEQLQGSNADSATSTDHHEPAKMVYKVNIEELKEKILAKDYTQRMWEALPDTPLDHLTPVHIGGHLLAIGGGLIHNIHLRYPKQSIFLYHDNKWVKVQKELSTPRFFSACSVLPNDEIIVAGGQKECEYISDVEFLHVYQLQ